MDKTALAHAVSNHLLLLEEQLRSFVANAQAGTLRSAMHNLYYAAFNATCALLAAKGISVESHDGAQSMLALHFVKPGVLRRDTTSKLNDLMSKRHAADYKGEVYVGADEVLLYRPWVVDFVTASLALIKKTGLKVDAAAVAAAAVRAGAVKIEDANNDTGGR
jgi:uncharacterized protein (UPF0332 family)